MLSATVQARFARNKFFIASDGHILRSGADDFLRPELEARGYRGAFIAKCTSPAASYGYGADGCALFWRDSRLQLVAGPEREHCKPLVQGLCAPRQQAAGGRSLTASSVP